MTLLAVALRHDAVVYASDRRLTAGSRLVDDEANKLTFLACNDARVFIGFTGLARTSVFDTEQWIIRALGRVVRGRTSIDSILDALADAATSDIPISDKGKPLPTLSLLIAGFYHPKGEAAWPRAWLLSNRSTGPSPGGPARAFRVESLVSSGLPALYFAGAEAAVAASTRHGVHELLKTPIPPHAIEARLHSMVRGAARSAAGYTIGESITTGLMFKEANSVVHSIYYASSPARRAFAPGYIVSINGASPFITCNAELISGSDNPLVSVPRTRRNRPCPCGSGTRYKKCHGLLSYPYLPISSRIDISENPPPSGSSFWLQAHGAAGRSPARSARKTGSA